MRRTLKALLAIDLTELGVFLSLVVVHAVAPYGLVRDSADLAGVALGLTSVVAISFAAVYGYLAHPSLRKPIVFVIILVLATLAAHLYIINNPELPACRDSTTHVNGCIMDEVYYVPAAENMLNGTQCGPTVPNCNMEHPFLSKALIAAGIAAFGDNAFGWRILNVLMGTFCLPLLFALVLRVSKNRKLAYIATILLAFDVMFFSQSSAALLDIPSVFFGLLAFVSYAYEAKVWLLDRYVISGVFMGLSVLCKETGIFLALALVTYHLLTHREGERLPGDEMKHMLFSAVEFLCVSAVVFALGMQAYDSLFASHAFPVFIDQLKYILSYGSSLIGPGWTFGNNIQITPFNWMTYYQPVTYYGTSVTVYTTPVNGTSQVQYIFPGVAYYGVTNLIETWTTYIWFPLAVLLAWRVYAPVQRGLEKFGFTDPARRLLSGEQKVLILALVWFSWTYFPYILLFVLGRVTYPFYFIPAVPAVAIGAGYFLTRKWVPKYAMILYLVGAFGLFFLFYPSKAFFPDWLRALIGK
jgi:4-amino-4-deoxy-L-arabinose transferase-like glycosyltransferase